MEVFRFVLIQLAAVVCVVDCQLTSHCTSVGCQQPSPVGPESRVLLDEIRRLRQQLDDSAPPRPADSCAGYPSGWTYLQSVHKYYRVIFESVDWNTADSRCRELGNKSHLVAVSDAAENQAIKAFLASFHPRLSRICDGPRVLYSEGYGGYWTSGQRQNSTQCGDTPWVWKPYPTMQYPVNFTDWYPGQPNCRWDTEQCLHYGTNWFFDYQWNDVNCGWVACPLCELTF